MFKFNVEFSPRIFPDVCMYIIRVERPHYGDLVVLVSTRQPPLHFLDLAISVTYLSVYL